MPKKIIQRAAVFGNLIQDAGIINLPPVGPVNWKLGKLERGHTSKSGEELVSGSLLKCQEILCHNSSTLLLGR